MNNFITQITKTSNLHSDQRSENIFSFIIDAIKNNEDNLEQRPSRPLNRTEIN